MSRNIYDELKSLTEKLDVNLRSLDEEKLEIMELPLNQLRDDVRETIQENLRDPVMQIIKKLKKNKELTSGDIQIIEKWIVGDAEYYAKIENNLNDWITECKRLSNVLKNYEVSDIKENENKLFVLGALLTDLKFTLTDVIRYSKALDRIKRFKSSIGSGSLNKETKKWLADLMERQLFSDEF